MKEIIHFSDEFKKSVIKELLNDHITKDEVRRQYGIKGKSLVLD